MARTVFVQIGFSAAGLISYFRESCVGGAYWATPCIPPPINLLSLVFICQENPSQSGILQFPNRPRFCQGEIGKIGNIFPFCPQPS